MPEYLVYIEIEVQAPTPADAAQRAWRELTELYAASLVRVSVTDSDGVPRFYDIRDAYLALEVDP